MSAIAIPAPAPISGSGIAGVGRFIRDTALLTVQPARGPACPSACSTLIQPIVFTLLFMYVFGSAIHVPGVSYKDYLFPGIIGQSLAFGIIGRRRRHPHDMTEGVIDRFRSLLISWLADHQRAQVMGLFCEQVLGMTIVVVFGLILGWNLQLSAAHAVELVALMVLAMLVLTWMGVLLDAVRSPGRWMQVGFIADLFLNMFLAGTFVPIVGTDFEPRAIAPLGSDLGPGRQRARSHRGRALERVVAARPSRARDGPAWCLADRTRVCVPLALRRFNTGRSLPDRAPVDPSPAGLGPGWIMAWEDGGFSVIARPLRGLLQRSRVDQDPWLKSSAPVGSTAALAPRSAAANGSGRWRSYHGRCVRPIAWWWVIVPPPAITASEAARLSSAHCSSSPPRRAGARIV